MMDAKYSVDTSHFFLSLNVFMMMFTLSEALCPGLGQLENGTTFFRYGGRYAIFTCNPGFKLLGHVRNSCISGMWRQPVPVCVASGCHLPTGILHGSLQTSHNNAAITFICNKGYKIFGSSFIYCNGKRWNSTLPICRESDMMSARPRKTSAQMSSSLFMGNPPLSIKLSEDLHKIYYNTTQNEADNYNNDINSTSNSTTTIKDMQHKKGLYQHKELLKFGENKIQDHLTPGEKQKSTNKSSPGEKFSAEFSSIKETHTESPKINITNWYNLSNMVQNEKQAEQWRESKTSKMVTIPFPTRLNNYTVGNLVHKYRYPKTEIAETYRNAFTSLSHGQLPHLKTPSKDEEQVKWTQSGEVFIGINNTHQSKFIQRNQSFISDLLNKFSGSVTPEVTSSISSILKSTHGPPKYVTANANKYITDHSKYDKTEDKSFSTIPTFTGYTASIINDTKMFPVLLHQVTQGSFPHHKNTTNGHYYKYSKALYEVTTKQPTLYKTTSIQSLHPAREPSVTIHGKEEINVTAPKITSSTSIHHKATTNRNKIHHGALNNALKKRVRCFYPPVPIHGTFRFLTLKDPLPNQYQYYIQYYCYPEYTMTQGDEYSFCMENGVWSGVTPICEDI